jgi:hypothetical protein
MPTSDSQRGEAPTPTEPGWYNDPSGKDSHQAYWDGQQWTGATRSGSSAPADVPPKGGGVPGWVWLLVAALVGVALIASWIGGTEGRVLSGTLEDIASSLEGSNTASNPSDRIVLEGKGDGATRSFSLGGGSYAVTTEVGNDCFYSFTLKDPSDGSRVESITSMTEPGSTTVSLHGIDPGSYYVDVITGPAPSCPWEQVWVSS